MVTGNDAVVGCGLYIDGRRQAPEPDTRHALQLAHEHGGFVWIGLFEPSEQQFADIADIFALPALAVEDAIRAHQRPKLEIYDDLTFVVIKPVRYVDSDEIVDVSELALFLGKRFVVAVRHGSSGVPAAVRADVNHDPQLLRHGPSAVLYRAADAIVDGYIEAIAAIADDIDEIETQVFSGDNRNHSQRIYKLKREVLEFHRAVVPLVVVTQRFAEHENVPGISKDIRHRFRDVHDHLLRAADAIAGFDRLLTDALQADLAQINVRLSETATRQNEDMRKISAWAAIALVPTAIAGIYGMNFDNMPELHTHYGYFVVLTVIATVCVGLYGLFRKNHWL
ncbi:MAG: magnesium and cobalt transport protein CorA [Mycobacteriales bacterium]